MALSPHAGYRKLRSFQVANLIYEVTMKFCDAHIDKRSRTHDQMVQAARSCVQNIAEGSATSVTSKKSELKLTGVARASLDELLQDYICFLHHRELNVWDLDDPRILLLRKQRFNTPDQLRNFLMSVKWNASGAECAANAMISLIQQDIYLLERQLQRLNKDFIEEGGITEKLYRERKIRRDGMI